jgi:thiol-disulfide isomerase/thioredoxin
VQKKQLKIQKNSILILVFILILSACNNKEQPVVASDTEVIEPVDSSNTSTDNFFYQVKGVSPSGDTLELGKVNSKIILLDFWASWCGPCRKVHPELVKVYQKYNKQGFEIFSISLDESKEDWQKAIAKDKLSWKFHISELNSWDSKYAKMFQIEYIPNNILYDNKGNVLAKELEPAQLDKILSEILTK